MYKTLNDVYYDTIPFRQRDNRNSSFLSDYRKKMTRTKNYRKNKQTSKISNQKRQILIDNAFKKYYNLENLSQDQTVEICTNVNNSDNSSLPTTTQINLLLMTTNSTYLSFCLTPTFTCQVCPCTLSTFPIPHHIIHPQFFLFQQENTQCLVENSAQWKKLLFAAQSGTGFIFYLSRRHAMNHSLILKIYLFTPSRIHAEDLTLN